MSGFFSVVGQLASDNTSMLLAYGPLGLICAWFMLRAERVFVDLKDIGHRIDGLTRAMLVDMIERGSTGHRTKEYAREAIAKIDARSAKK